MSDQQPATKADLAELETRIVDRLTELIRDTETRLLKAFHAYAEGQSSRLRELEFGRERTLERLAAAESRILELERRVYGKMP
jgi:hypothetical protein